jgi:hypothetical protein
MRWIIAAMIAAGALGPECAMAQTPARFYWKTLSGANAMPAIFQSISGNSNPFDPAHDVISADAKVEATLALAGGVHTFTLFDRSAFGAFLVPMGRLSGTGTVSGKTFNQAANGFGDPMFEFDLNVLGPRAQKNIPDALRYEPGFSVDVLGDLAVPIGKYNNTQPMNLGQNRWYGRLGAPIVWQLGAWVPGRRTTLELLPAVWLFSRNDDFVGQTLDTKPMFELDAHLTRDFTEHFWASLDAIWYNGGQATISGTAGEKKNNSGFGFGVGYAINDNLGLTVSYKSTVSDSAPTDLRMDNFTVSLVYGWHPLIEGMSRLKGGN